MFSAFNYWVVKHSAIRVRQPALRWNFKSPLVRQVLVSWHVIVQFYLPSLPWAQHGDKSTKIAVRGVVYFPWSCTWWPVAKRFVASLAQLDPHQNFEWLPQRRWWGAASWSHKNRRIFVLILQHPFILSDSFKSVASHTCFQISYSQSASSSHCMCTHTT